MDYFELRALRQHHAAWRLLLADHAPLIVGFFHRAFIRANRRSIAQTELASLLDDELFRIRAVEGAQVYPRAAKDYLDDWARGETAFLRKYFPKGKDEAEFDLTPAAEQAVEWLRSLEQKQFVGTESRLQTVFQLLRELVQLTELDRAARIAELQRQKAMLETQIAHLENGAPLTFDGTQVKERFFQIEDNARRLLADFRQVEENFRRLDRQVREKIAVSEDGKGALLDSVFGDQDAIADSDQGKSFRAFWAYLMSPTRQGEMSAFVERIYALPPVQDLTPSDFLRDLRFQLLAAGEKVQRTGSLLVEQLKRYLDERVWMENKRIMQLIGMIERQAVAVKDAAPTERVFAWISDVKPALELPLARSLFRPAVAVQLADVEVDEGAAEFDAAALYQQHYVDTARLQANLRQALQRRAQISLAQLCEEFPLEQGLSELVAYLNLASQAPRASIDADARQSITWQQTNGQWRRAQVPLVVFTR